MPEKVTWVHVGDRNMPLDEITQRDCALAADALRKQADVLALAAAIEDDTERRRLLVEAIGPKPTRKKR